MEPLTAAEMYPRQYRPNCVQCAGMGCAQCAAPEPERDEAREQAISDLVEKIANLPGITPADLELLEEIVGNGK